MKEVICPQCHTAFTIDETNYASIVKQIRLHAFCQRRNLPANRQHRIVVHTVQHLAIYKSNGAYYARKLHYSYRKQNIQQFSYKRKSFNSSCKLRLVKKILLFTVPKGNDNLSAISRYLNPETNILNGIL